MGIIIGAIIGGLLFGWLFDLGDPVGVMSHEKGDVGKGKGCAGVILILLAIIALLLIEASPVMVIGGIPTK